MSEAIYFSSKSHKDGRVYTLVPASAVKFVVRHDVERVYKAYRIDDGGGCIEETKFDELAAALSWLAGRAI